MGNLTRFGVIVSERKAEIHQHQLPTIHPDEILLANKSCNICTTDYQQWMGLRPHQPIPMAFGHENCGVVVEVGGQVENIQAGDHAVVNIYGPCMECEDCRRGRNTVSCKFSTFSNLNLPNQHGYYGYGGCSQFQNVKSKHIFKVSNDLPFEFAGFAEPLSTVLHGMKKLRLKTGEKLLVIGAGPMGNLNAQVGRYFGAEVTVADVSQKKLRSARTLGFTRILNAADSAYLERAKAYSRGAGFDVVIIAVGVAKAYRQALKMVADHGRLLIFASGYPRPEWHLDPNSVHYQQWQIIGTFGCTVADFQEAVDILNNKSIDVSPLIEERFPLEEIQQAFEKASMPDTYRISVGI
jgi:L-iditol 2-dehydrogenase